MLYFWFTVSLFFYFFLFYVVVIIGAIIVKESSVFSMHALKGFFQRMNTLLLQLLCVLYIQLKLINIRFTHLMLGRIIMKQMPISAIHMPFLSRSYKKRTNLFLTCFLFFLKNNIIQFFICYSFILFTIMIWTLMQKISFFFSLAFNSIVKRFPMLYLKFFDCGFNSVHLVVASLVFSVWAGSILIFFIWWGYWV